MTAKALIGPLRIVGGKIAHTDNYSRIVTDQIKDSVMTNYRERVMRPEYGADLQSLNFDPISSLRRSDAAEMLKARLTQMVPRATILSVEFNDSIITEPGEIGFNVRYSVNEYEDPQSVDFTFNPLTEIEA